MAKYVQYYREIRSLRGQGYTYSEVCSTLGLVIPKSTLTFICRDVKLPKSYSEKIKQLTAQNLNTQRKKALAVNRKQRDAHLEALHNNAKDVVSEKSGTELSSLKIALAMLYLGEGAKWPSF